MVKKGLQVSQAWVVCKGSGGTGHVGVRERVSVSEGL